MGPKIRYRADIYANMSEFDPQIQDGELLNFLQQSQAGEKVDFVETSAVAEEFDVRKHTARKHLRRLVKDEELEEIKAGALWRTTDSLSKKELQKKRAIYNSRSLIFAKNEQVTSNELKKRVDQIDESLFNSAVKPALDEMSSITIEGHIYKQAVLNDHRSSKPTDEEIFSRNEPFYIRLRQYLDKISDDSEERGNRYDTIFDIYNYIRQEGSAELSDFEQFVDSNKLGYGSFNSFWTNCVNGGGVLVKIPGVSKEGKKRNREYKYTSPVNNIEWTEDYDPDRCQKVIEEARDIIMNSEDGVDTEYILRKIEDESDMRIKKSGQAKLNQFDSDSESGLKTVLNKGLAKLPEIILTEDGRWESIR